MAVICFVAVQALQLNNEPHPDHGVEVSAAFLIQRVGDCSDSSFQKVKE